MFISALFSAAIWPAIVNDQCAPQVEASIVGIAKDEHDKILYCEIVTKGSTNSLKVSYFSEGKIFAEKNLDFSKSLSLPSVSQSDFRVGEIRRAQVSEQNVELAYQANSQKKINQALIPTQKVDVIDAGFDNFIRDHWEELQTGKTISVNFASMAHLKALPLRVSLKPPEKCIGKNNSDSSSFCFYVEIDNAILRMLLGNIKLTYDLQHRLHEFNGVGNILSDSQENQTVAIRYFYASDYQAAEK